MLRTRKPSTRSKQDVTRNHLLVYRIFSFQNLRNAAVYFADDDNYYDLRVFAEIQKVCKVGVMPVGMPSPEKKLKPDLSGMETPICKDNKVGVHLSIAWTKRGLVLRSFFCFSGLWVFKVSQISDSVALTQVAGWIVGFSGGGERIFKSDMAGYDSNIVFSRLTIDSENEKCFVEDFSIALCPSLP